MFQSVQFDVNLFTAWWRMNPFSIPHVRPSVFFPITSSSFWYEDHEPRACLEGCLAPGSHHGCRIQLVWLPVWPPRPGPTDAERGLSLSQPSWEERRNPAFLWCNLAPAPAAPLKTKRYMGSTSSFSRITSILPPKPTVYLSFLTSLSRIRSDRTGKPFAVTVVGAPFCAAGRNFLVRSRWASLSTSILPFELLSHRPELCHSLRPAAGHPCSSARRLNLCQGRRPRLWRPLALVAAWSGRRISSLSCFGEVLGWLLIQPTKQYLTLIYPTPCTQPNIHLNSVLHQIGQARLSQDGRYDAVWGYIHLNPSV